jgi:hypothetical protein
MHKPGTNLLFAGTVILLTATILAATAVNYKQDKAVDRTKLPQKLEQAKPFQKWLTNLKNTGLTVEADEFRLNEENEIYNTNWMKVYSIDDPSVKTTYDLTIAKYTTTDKVIYAPSGRQFIDYRNEPRDGFAANEIHYYGLRDDKLLDARLLDCSTKLNCYFDRAYFLDNDVFVVSELSRNLDKRAADIPVCLITEPCTYTIKVHLVDLNKNSRLIYESRPFEVNLALLIPEL